MKDVVSFKLEEGGSVLLEVEDDDPGARRVGRGDGMVSEAAASFDSAMDTIRSAADVLVAKVRGLTERPDEVVVQFGVKLKSKVGAVIASGEAEGHFQVTLTWKRA